MPSTPSPRPVVDARTFNHPTYSQPTNVEQDYPPLFPNYHLEYVCQLPCKQ